MRVMVRVVGTLMRVMVRVMGTLMRVMVRLSGVAWNHLMEETMQEWSTAHRNSACNIGGFFFPFIGK